MLYMNSIKELMIYNIIEKNNNLLYAMKKRINST